MHEHLDIQGLDEAAERLVGTLEEADYLVMTDRTDRKREVRIARLEMTVDAVGPYLGGDTWELDVQDLPTDLTCLDADILERALTRWMKSVILERGDEPGRYRVRSYATKAMTYLVTRTLNVERSAGHEPSEVPAPTLPMTVNDAPDFAPTFEDMEMQAAQTGMRALGSYYAQWGAMMLGSMRQVQGVHQDMIVRLHSQVQDSRGQVDELLAALLETRATASLVQAQQDDRSRQDETRTLLAQQAIHGIGEAAKAFAMAKSGVTPALAGVAEQLSASPELMEVLQSDDVRDLLKDPTNLKAVAMMLKQAAGAKAVAEAKAAT